MGHRPAFARDLTSTALREGFDRMRAHLDREARNALAEDPAPAVAPPSTPPRGGPSGRKAAAKE